MIIKAQPYQRENSELETLSLISRLENADKHRSLIAVGHGVMNARSVVTAAEEIIKQETAGFRPNGAEIAKFGFRDRVPDESEVTVEVSGTAAIAIKVTGTDGYFANGTGLSPRSWHAAGGGRGAGQEQRGAAARLEVDGGGERAATPDAELGEFRRPGRRGDPAAAAGEFCRGEPGGS
jgi:hypothetical protein